MRFRGKVCALLLVVMACGVASAGPEEAAKAFTAGKALLAKGDFDGAAKALKEAAAADPNNSAYFQEAALLKRVMNLRKQIAEEKDAETWQAMARALYGYYRQNGIQGEALTLAQALHSKAGTGESAALLADAYLAADQNEAAATLLAGLKEDAVTPRTVALRGVALARLGETDEAQALAAKFALPKECDDAALCFDAARLYALTGDKDKALATLKCALECTPGNQLAAVRAEAKACKDLAAVAGSEEFAKVLATESKAVGGCGKCPSRDKCAGGEKKEAGCGTHEKSGDKKDAGCEEYEKK